MLNFYESWTIVLALKGSDCLQDLSSWLLAQSHKLQDTSMRILRSRLKSYFLRRTVSMLHLPEGKLSQRMKASLWLRRYFGIEKLQNYVEPTLHHSVVLQSETELLEYIQVLTSAITNNPQTVGLAFVPDGSPRHHLICRIF